MSNLKISDAELEVMKALWSAEGAMTGAQIREALSNGWERTTVATLLTRLEEKGAVKSQPQGRGKSYLPLIAQTDYAAQQTKNLVSALYGGSVKNLMAAMYSGGELDKSDIQELRQLIENWEGGDD
jgi:predicted transcriptional regulator